MTPELIAFVAPAALLAAVCGYLLCRTRSAAALAALQQRFDALQNEADALRADLNARTHALAERDKTVGEQQTELALRAEQLTTLRARQQEAVGDLNTTKETLAELQQRHAEQAQQLSARQSQLDAEQRRSQELRDSVAELKQQLADLDSQADQVRAERNELNEALASARSSLEAAAKANQERQDTITQLRTDLKDQQAQTAKVQTERNELAEQLATLRTTLDKERKHVAEQRELLEEDKQKLEKSFENLANKIFDAKGKAFSDQHRQSLDDMLKPFKEQLESFRKRADDIHTTQTSHGAALKTELAKMQELNKRITEEAANLTKALKGDKKKQGNWGELQVEMILDQSGLRKGREYESEANYKDDDRKNWRPDFVVHLPEGKHVVIDSKVSLNAYTDYVAAETDVERDAALNRHVEAVRKHINDLYERDYSGLPGINSPDFVFMFMPIEPAFIAAFEHDQKLFNNAFEKHVVVVTPSTLLATLRTIANLWNIERQNQSARILADQAGRVYDKLRVFVEKMDKLGNQLSTMQKTYEDANNSLTGSRSLTATVQKFVDLGVRVKKELPAAVVERAALDDEDLASLQQVAKADGSPKAIESQAVNEQETV